ncbi:hypothetical protein [Nonomuraea salmonea]|uniref:hypothetical protein n=1 Tax=Nonomuraea salmonea TaxID=46181 RepID=UPI002FEB0572
MAHPSRPAAASHPPDILAHLVEAGFNDTAPPYAALTGVVDGREHLLALVTGYLPDARDGWEWCVDEAVAGTTAFAAAVGRLTADLHLALSTLPPTPLRRHRRRGPPRGCRPRSGRGSRSGRRRRCPRRWR